MKKIDPLKYLSRNDKWYLGGGNRLIWTPPFPVWLDKPGFWDKAHYYNIEFEPVFTWTLLDGEGNEIPIRQTKREWNPARLRSEFEPIIGKRKYPLSIVEEKCCSPDDCLCSSIDIVNTSGKPIRLHLIAWTIQPNYPSKRTTWLEDISVRDAAIFFRKNIQLENKPLQRFFCALSMKGGYESSTINLSEGSAIQPHWRLTPFAEKFSRGKFGNECKLTGINNDGLVYIAIHKKITVPSHGSKNSVIMFSAAPTAKESVGNITRTSKSSNVIERSERAWNNYFSRVPYFACSDEFITRYYWYRWYGLHLLTLKGGEGNYKYPSVCEGIGYFRAPITYSAMCHILENRWLHKPDLAQGSLLTFIHNQRKDGGFRGYVDLNYYRQEMFYHGNWGNSLLELNRCHQDRAFLQKAYTGLVKYVEYFDRERDGKGSDLYDIDNHYETGQEYMHRYLAVNPNADKDNWGEVFRLKGVDVTVYIYELKKALASVASLLGKPQTEIRKWKTGAEKIRLAVRQNMWDPVSEMFFDVNPKTMKRTGVKAAVCFYPYMTDIVTADHVDGLKKHLLNPKEFWTEFPAPSSSVDDKYYSSDAEWKGKRMNCPWNGRTWPMTNSHIAEALAVTSLRFRDNELRQRTVEFITKFLQMMFFDGDSSRPNCFEHYNPVTGKASEYRGVDDYQHSWVNDLILKYVAGIKPMDTGIMVDPFPFGLDHFVADGIMIRGKLIKVECRGAAFEVRMDGKKVLRSSIGKAVFIRY